MGLLNNDDLIMGLPNNDEPKPPALGEWKLLPARQVTHDTVHSSTEIAGKHRPEKTNLEHSVGDTSPQNSSPSEDLSTGVSRSPTHNISAEYLGAKTGKTDFFMAREQNKLALMAERAERRHRRVKEEFERLAAARQQLPRAHVSSWFSPEDMPLQERWAPALQPLAPLPLPRLADVAEPYAPPTSPGLGLADGYRPLSPPMAFPVTMPGDVDSFSRRTHVGISDLVETHQQSPCNKRKADEMSESTREQDRWAFEIARAAQTENTNPTTSASQEDPSKEEERVPGSSQYEDSLPCDMALSLNQSTIVEEPNTSVSVSSKQGEVNAESSVMTPSKQGEITEGNIITPPLTPERPAKKPRMMMVAERLGYAALGGVTAGAMIMGTLIYTAPTFG
jgi:hypothetical protein